MTLTEFVRERNVTQLEIILGARTLHVRTLGGGLGTVESIRIERGFVSATVRHFNGEMMREGLPWNAARLIVIDRPEVPELLSRPVPCVECSYLTNNADATCSDCRPEPEAADHEHVWRFAGRGASKCKCGILRHAVGRSR